MIKNQAFKLSSVFFVVPIKGLVHHLPGYPFKFVLLKDPKHLSYGVIRNQPKKIGKGISSTDVRENLIGGKTGRNRYDAGAHGILCRSECGRRRHRSAEQPGRQPGVKVEDSGKQYRKTETGSRNDQCEG